MRVFVAGASGAIGKPLIAELLRQGHSVVGMTTNEARAKELEEQGAEAVIADKAYDSDDYVATIEVSGAAAVIPPTPWTRPVPCGSKTVPRTF